MDAISLTILTLVVGLLLAWVFYPGLLCPCHLCEEILPDRLACRKSCRVYREWKTEQERRAMARDERVERSKGLAERLRAEIARLRAMLAGRKA